MNVFAEERRRDGGKLPDDKCNKYQSGNIHKLGNVAVQALASFYKDDNFRSLLLERGIKLLNIFITCYKFLHIVVLKFSSKL